MRRPSVGEPACEKSGLISPQGGFLKAPVDGNAPFAGSVCSTTTHGDADMALKKLSILTAGFIVLAAGVFPASAQYRDRDDRRGGFSLRFGDDDEDRGWRRGRDRDCHYETRRYRDRNGDMVVRRSRVCDDD